MSNNVYKDPYKERTIEELTLQRAAQRKSRKDKKTYGLKDGDLVEMTGGGGKPVEVDDRLSGTSENPVQNKVITGALGGKQNELISGSTIKTVNGNSLLGSGNIEITAGGGTISVDSEISDTSENPVQNKAIKKALDKKQDTLISEYNIKSINGQTLLEGGILTIKEGHDVDAALSKDSTNPVQNKVVSEQLIPVSEAVGDKAYNPSDFSGMARVNLPKNGGVLTQDMMPLETGKNTIYIIQYDYTLNDQTITVPENCVLKFDGGSLKQGTLEGNNSNIEAGCTDYIFKDNLLTTGGFKCPCYVEWFGAKGYREPTKDSCSSSIQRVYDSVFYEILFNVGYYYLDSTININKLKNTYLKGYPEKSIVPTRGDIKERNYDYVSSFLWSDLNITLLKFYFKDYLNIKEYQRGTFDFKGGAVDVSLCENYNTNVIELDRSPKMNIHPYIKTSIFGHLYNVSPSYTYTKSTGLFLNYLEQSSQGAIYGGVLDLYIQHFSYGILSNFKNASNNLPWINSMKINLKSDGNRYAIDLGDSGISGGTLSGFHQTKHNYFLPDNEESCIIGNLKDLTISLYCWDIDASNGTNKYAFDLGLEDSGAIISDKAVYNILEDNYNGSYLTSKEKMSSLNIFPRNNREFGIGSGHYLELVSNNLYAIKNNVIAENCSVSSTAYKDPLQEGLIVRDIVDSKSKITVSIDNLDAGKKFGKLIINTRNPNFGSDAIFKKIKVDCYNSEDIVFKSKVFDIVPKEYIGTLFQISLLYNINNMVSKLDICFYDSVKGDSGNYIFNIEGGYFKNEYEHIATRDRAIFNENADIRFGANKLTIKKNHFNLGDYDYLPIPLEYFESIDKCKEYLLKNNLPIGTSLILQVFNGESAGQFKVNVGASNSILDSSGHPVKTINHFKSGGLYSDIPRETDGVFTGKTYFSTDLNKLLVRYGNKWVDSNGIDAEIKNKGLSSERPTSEVDDGFCYYDTSIGLPIWKKGLGWIKADGTDADAPAPAIENPQV